MLNKHETMPRIVMNFDFIQTPAARLAAGALSVEVLFGSL